jgi:hypothetical protein
MESLFEALGFLFKGLGWVLVAFFIVLVSAATLNIIGCGVLWHLLVVPFVRWLEA